MPRISVDDDEPDSTPTRRRAPIASEVEIKPGPVKKAALSLVDEQLKEKSGTSFLAAFDAYPRDIIFTQSEAGEELVLLLRAHIVTNIPWLLIAVGMILAPLLLLPLLNILAVPVSAGTSLALVLFWYLGTFTYAFLNFLYWYFNVYIVTSERVVDIDWFSVIYRKVSSAQISHIEDVSSVQGGVFAGVFDYGNVEIQTAAEEENFEFAAVPHPQLIARKIQDLMEKDDQEGERHR